VRLSPWAPAAVASFSGKPAPSVLATLSYVALSRIVIGSAPISDYAYFLEFNTNEKVQGVGKA
jgi:hypothetical protein